MLKNKQILLVISGGIAAYKSLELIRLLRKQGATVQCVLTKGGEQFVTPMSVAALSENPVYQELFSLKDESEMGHIRLSREADFVVIAPASANMIAKIANGLADDLASTTLLANNKPVILAPAMNPVMWDNQATQDNIKTLKNRGFEIIEPESGEMACGEVGKGRMAEPDAIVTELQTFIAHTLPMRGLSALITAGPTHEPIDPVRFIGNHSSGKQGYAIAQELADKGVDVTLVSGPVSLASPSNVKLINVTTAKEMLAACEDALPADITICTAAVSDWTVKNPKAEKIKKCDSEAPPSLEMTENPDILAHIANHPDKRPALVIGFAAETNNLIENAQRKLENKGCNWILANDVSPENNVFGTDQNCVYFVSSDQEEQWTEITKAGIAKKLQEYIRLYFSETKSNICEIAAE